MQVPKQIFKQFYRSKDVIHMQVNKQVKSLKRKWEQRKRKPEELEKREMMKHYWVQYQNIQNNYRHYVAEIKKI